MLCEVVSDTSGEMIEKLSCIRSVPSALLFSVTASPSCPGLSTSGSAWPSLTAQPATAAAAGPRRPTLQRHRSTAAPPHHRTTTPQHHSTIDRIHPIYRHCRCCLITTQLSAFCRRLASFLCHFTPREMLR